MFRSGHGLPLLCCGDVESNPGPEGVAEFVQFSETYAARIAAGIAPFDLTKLEVKIHMRISQSGVPATIWATHAGRQGFSLEELCHALALYESYSGLTFERVHEDQFAFVPANPAVVQPLAPDLVHQLASLQAELAGMKLTLSQGTPAPPPREVAPDPGGHEGVFQGPPADQVDAVHFGPINHGSGRGGDHPFHGAGLGSGAGQSDQLHEILG